MSSGTETPERSTRPRKRGRTPMSSETDTGNASGKTVSASSSAPTKRSRNEPIEDCSDCTNINNRHDDRDPNDSESTVEFDRPVIPLVDSSSSTQIDSSLLSPLTAITTTVATAGTSSSITSHRPAINSAENQLINNVDNDNEYSAAIKAAKLRLHSAQQSVISSSRSLQMIETNLQYAKSEYNRCREEEENAWQFLKSVERKWGVIDIDSDSDSGCNKSDNEASTAPRAENNSVNLDTDIKNASFLPIQKIEINNAGEPLVNGIYDVHRHSTSADQTTSLDNIYVHSEGPFTLHGVLHDFCIFRKDGYGDKVRWCVAMVPCADTIPDGGDARRVLNYDNDKSCNSTETPRNWDFSQAYIYYWAEVPVYSAESPPLYSFDWGVCHGARPLPELKEVESETGTGFWSQLRFWNWLS